MAHSKFSKVFIALHKHFRRIESLEFLNIIWVYFNYQVLSFKFIWQWYFCVLTKHSWFLNLQTWFHIAESLSLILNKWRPWEKDLCVNQIIFNCKLININRINIKFTWILIQFDFMNWRLFIFSLFYSDSFLLFTNIFILRKLNLFILNLCFTLI